MSWRIRITLLALFAAGFAALLPLTRAPAGDLCPGAEHRCGLTVLKKKVPVMLVNSRRIRLNYNIAEVGPSGISAVELWATRDGSTWQRYSNEPPPAGPLCVQVAEEGRYGFSLVVKNGLGVASPAPQTGDAPQMWVEVDETCPSVQLTECCCGKGTDAGSLHIGWTASDENLASKGVTISTAVSKEGPWTPIASGLENTGKHVWKMPKDTPFEFYVKVESADRAGNVGGDHTPRPVKVDLARPRGTIIGVETEKKYEVKVEPVQETAAPPAPHVFNSFPEPRR
jgi:hypothetical protein